MTLKFFIYVLNLVTCNFFTLSRTCHGHALQSFFLRAFDEG